MMQMRIIPLPQIPARNINSANLSRLTTLCLSGLLLACWFVGTLAVHYQMLELYVPGFILNVIFGWTVNIAHTLQDPEAIRFFKKIWRTSRLSKRYAKKVRKYWREDKS